MTLASWPGRGAAVSAFILAAVFADAQTITLEQALVRALQDSANIKTADAESKVAEGELVRAKTLPNNPTVSAGMGPHTDLPATDAAGQREYAASLEQTLEIGGQRGQRVAAAKARLAGNQGRAASARQTVASRVRRAFALAATARERLATTRDAERVAAELQAFAVDRLTLGAGTQLELNVSRAAAGRARSERLIAERRFRIARTDLADAMGAPPAEVPEPDGPPPSLVVLSMGEEEFVRRAVAQRGDLATARQETVAAGHDLTLEKRLRIPNPSLAVTYARTPEERSLLFGVTIGLPLFNRNQGGIAIAGALSQRASTVEQNTARSVEREARATYAAYENAREGAEGFDREVVERLMENINLARESFEAGKISLLEFNLLRRELVETRLSYLDALAELVEARFALELAVGGGLE
jgi:cobalt-zinc-cadmium efflux system outer membrane protein